MLRIAHRCKAVMLASIATHWYFPVPRSLERVYLNRIYYSSCAQPPQNLRTLPLHPSHTITCSTLDLPFNHLPNSSIPWTPTSPIMVAPGAATQGYWDSVDYPLEWRPGRYSYRSPDPRCTCGVVQNGYSSQGLRLCSVRLYDDIDDEDVFSVFSFSSGLGNMNMSS